MIEHILFALLCAVSVAIVVWVGGDLFTGESFQMPEPSYEIQWSKRSAGGVL